MLQYVFPTFKSYFPQNIEVNKTNGGAVDNTKSFITPKPLVVGSSVLYYCNPWLKMDIMGIGLFLKTTLMI